MEYKDQLVYFSTWNDQKCTQKIQNEDDKPIIFWKWSSARSFKIQHSCFQAFMQLLLLFSPLLVYQGIHTLFCVLQFWDSGIYVQNFNPWTTNSFCICFCREEPAGGEEKGSCAGTPCSMWHAVSAAPSCAKGGDVILPNPDTNPPLQLPHWFRHTSLGLSLITTCY